MTKEYTGGCACGAVTFMSKSKPAPVVACHCSQCRRQTGLYYASCDVSLDCLTIEGKSSIRWYRSSETAERGFCANCGSALFWQRKGSPEVSVMAGAFNLPSGLSFGYHIYCADKGDFYEINDGAPQYAKGV
ncbi:GFA family protein [Rhizobium sp. SEMIA 4085]|uniref:GFA family glutathione-dependent formaldehyde-activating protein n=1 Tax=Rhizobium gallicum bv. gallicum R602sp TaxID=1041138 RepID=A0A0B4X0P0_9HYPH|nr:MULTISPECIES: GFA family protein [Rhizobium]AJD41474.1 GFA family glutathione-dependent formaldehyde-activating protein [Rhizobium gallicum bv. gallicum R602sp]NNH29724.1 GFA family protein [Rhizobium sp. SEMIA 4085]